MTQEYNGLETLGQHGVCVSVKSSIWEGRKKLQPQDIGLTTTEWKSMEGKMKLGVKYIIDPALIRPFTTIRQRARGIVLENSIPLGELTGAFFVPNTTFVEMNEGVQENINEFYAKREEFLAEYDHNSNEWVKECRETALEFYDFISSKEPKDKFVTRFINNMVRAQPTKEALKEKFALRMSVFELAEPSNVYVEGAEHAARAAILDEYRKNATAQYKGILDTAFSELRSGLVELVNQVGSTLEDGKKFSDRTLNSVKKKAEKLRKLNFIHDAKLEENISSLEKLCNMGAKSYTSNDEMMTGLKNGLSKIKKSIMDDEDKGDVIATFGNKQGRRKVRV